MMHNTALVGYTSAYGMDSIIFNHTDLSLSFSGKRGQSTISCIHRGGLKQQQKSGMAPVLAYR